MRTLGGGRGLGGEEARKEVGVAGGRLGGAGREGGQGRARAAAGLTHSGLLGATPLSTLRGFTSEHAHLPVQVAERRLPPGLSRPRAAACLLHSGPGSAGGSGWTRGDGRSLSAGLSHSKAAWSSAAGSS